MNRLGGRVRNFIYGLLEYPKVDINRTQVRE